jgi:serine/threonine protein kinase
VKVCEDTLTGETYAVKILEEHKLKKKMFSRDPNNNKADQVIRSEVAILKKIYHPNIVRLIEIIED